MNKPHPVYTQLLQRTGEANPRPRIEPVRRLAELLGSPQVTYPVIHVAGTNGKTTTARAIAGLLSSYGLKTGLFTSPHLVDFRERILIDGEEISPDLLTASWEEMQTALALVDAELEAAGQGPITFFEALAVLAYTAFSDAPVEVAVVEIGMGGQWDATNIVEATVSVFTPVGLDHTAILGNTLSEIADTKAGIIKPGTTIVSAQQVAEVSRVLEDRAEENGTRILSEGKDFSLLADMPGVGGRVVEFRGLTGHSYSPVFMPLFGQHQSQNVALAVAAAEAFINPEAPLPQEVVEEALAHLRAPGRLETIGIKPHVLVDAAHNPHGAATLAHAVQESFSFTELLLVVGMFEDKDMEGVLTELLPLTTTVYAVGINSDRSSSPDEIAAVIKRLQPETELQVFDELPEAVEEARGWAEEQEGRGVLVTGSVFLVGEAIAHARASDWGTTHE